MEFVEKTLGQIESLIKTGKTPPSKVSSYYEGDINWYTPGDLDNDKYLGKSSRTITKDAVKEGKATLFPKNSILIGCIGDIGKLGITSELASSNQQITAIQTNEEVHYEYLYYYLKAHKYLLKGLSKNALLPILNNSNLRRLKISFPKLIDNQKRIAKVLSNCETLIQKRKESIDLLDKLLKSTFLEMFGDPVKNEKGWTRFALSKLTNKIGSGATPRGGKEAYQEVGVSLIRSLNVHDNKFVYKDLAFINNEQAKKLQNVIVSRNDVLFNITGASVCRCTIVPSEVLPARVNQHVAIIRTKSDILNPIYLSHLLISENFKKHLIKIATLGGATREAITKEQLKNLIIPVASIEIQNQFAQLVEKVESIKQLYQTHLIELENLYGSLSQKGFKAELDLSKVKISGSSHGIATTSGTLTNVIEDIETQVAGSLETRQDVIDKFFINKKESSENYTQDYVIKPFVWEDFSSQRIASIIKKRYKNFHFSIELLIRFLVEKEKIEIVYHSSEELKKKPELNSTQDLKQFIFSAIVPQSKDNPNPFLSLKQEFYNAVYENFDLRLLSDDYEFIKDRGVRERSGIYFSIIE